MKNLLLYLVFFVIIVTTPVINFLWFGSLWQAVAIEDTSVYNSEDDAAYAGSQSVKAAPVITMVNKGESVAVLWDTHGKDYWACYIRTEKGVRGWALCASLNKKQ
jgi:hypothetical protein